MSHHTHQKAAERISRKTRHRGMAFRSSVRVGMCFVLAALLLLAWLFPDGMPRMKHPSASRSSPTVSATETATMPEKTPEPGAAPVPSSQKPSRRSKSLPPSDALP